jgi:hypothetical protein
MAGQPTVLATRNPGAGTHAEEQMANDSVRLSDEMASALGLDAEGEHSRDDLGAAVRTRFAGGDHAVDGLASTPVHVLGELVVLLDAGGCQDLDASVTTALRESGSDDPRDAVQAVAHGLCGELAERHFMP